MTSTSDTDAIRGRLRWFLNGCSNLSGDWPPPATNAASFDWCKNTVNDPVLKLPIENPPNSSRDIIAFYDLARIFQTGLLSALSTPVAHGSLLSHPAVILPVVEHLAIDVFKVISDIWDIYGGSLTTKAAAIAKLKTDMEGLIDKINKEGTTVEGNYANGFISQQVHDLADSTLAALTALPKSSDQDAIRLADTLRIVCTQFKALETGDHTPWLKAEWQVAYQGILRAAADGLGA